MSYDMSKFERGQVWVVRFKNKNEQVGHEQGKDRPWVVLSIGKFNKSSGMVSMAPVTTRKETVSPAQVLFYNDRGFSNVILCEQIRTFDYTSGAYIFDFMGQLSDKVLEKVDVALSIHLGMHYSPITLNKLYDSMEAIVKSVGHMQDKDNTPKFSDNDVLNFAMKLQELAGASESSSEIAATSESTPTIDTIPESPVDTSTTKPEKEKKPRIRWTKEKCEEFLHDADTLPMKEVMEKWHISKKMRFYSMKNYVEGLIMTGKTRS